MVTQLLNRKSCNLLHSLEEWLKVLDFLKLIIKSLVHLLESLSTLLFTLFIYTGSFRILFLHRLMAFFTFVSCDNFSYLLYYNRVFLPDKVKCQLSLNVKEMLSELPWQVRVKVDEGVEGYPEFKGWQSDHFKHL